MYISIAWPIESTQEWSQYKIHIYHHRLTLVSDVIQKV